MHPKKDVFALFSKRDNRELINFGKPLSKSTGTNTLSFKKSLK